MVMRTLPFLGKKTNYDETLARQLLNMAAGAYGDQQEACLNVTFPSHDSHVLLLTTKEQCDHLGNTCEGYIAASEAKKRLTVVYRGTKTKGQLLLEGVQSVQPGIDFFGMGIVNRYFINAHLKLWSSVEKLLMDPIYKDYQIVFTGHSLGGALAALAAARTAKQNYRSGDQLIIYTFGEPRVGDVNFATSFDSMIPNRYPDSMEPGSYYMECVGEPKGEDFTCSDKIKFYYDQSNSYIWDHRHYFTVRVPEYGKTGCDLEKPEGKASVLEQVMCFLSPSPECEEHKATPTKRTAVVPPEVFSEPPSVVNKSTSSKKTLPFFVSTIISFFKGR
ncbi:triacylglycerol lipase [Dictyocaulus viviparus]|uniref:Triacylglycerol lipase n=1 Tax=Dictyocaulus viviparus TaxID=29172 RepID=A0A0D8Y9R4_DICVI|nr:triacylglycerol lipase [Dictyocaulus viviparus]